MKLPLITLIILLSVSACQEETKSKPLTAPHKASVASTLDANQAKNLLIMPMSCLNIEYPNKLSQTIGSAADLSTPQKLHPSFYGCFDWHSAVHGHWSIVKLLKQYPDIAGRKAALTKLQAHITPENIATEVAYFQGPHNKSYERTYGWAWLLKLAEELHTWDTPEARQLENNLQPLTDMIIGKYLEYLPKLNYPIRVGTHTNTAFGLTFAYDYARTTNHQALLDIITSRAKDFYLQDAGCPITWEPSGHDFLSPCLEEIDIMRRVLSTVEFSKWINRFMPELADPNFALAPGIVSDRTDGHLVHLDGVNFSRAWCLYGLALALPAYQHLHAMADAHIQHSIGDVIGDDYEGGHWLGSFAIYALSTSEE